MPFLGTPFPLELGGVGGFLGPTPVVGEGNSLKAITGLCCRKGYVCVRLSDRELESVLLTVAVSTGLFLFVLLV